MNDTICSVTIDCHAYAWHEVDPYFPECGPDNLVRMAETYGVLIEHLPDDNPDNPAPGWAWWYRIRGPRDNVVRLLADEYTGHIGTAEGMVDGCVGAYTPIGFRFRGFLWDKPERDS
jgi:hypothetical protein